MKQFLSGIDFAMLKEQKKALINDGKHEGIVNLIDKIQDIAVDEYGYASDLVFDTDTELPEWKQKSEEYFHNALCNAVGTGYINSYGLVLMCEDTDYKDARDLLRASEQSACLEDIWMQILRSGGTLTLEDVENEGDMTRSITLADVHDRVQKTPEPHLANMVNGNDDAETADVILQIVFFEDIVFG